MKSLGKEITDMGWKKGNSSLGQFHRDATAAGLTYAEAQIQETCSLIGKVRAPKDRQPGGTVYIKVSTRKIMERLYGMPVWKGDIPVREP